MAANERWAVRRRPHRSEYRISDRNTTCSWAHSRTALRAFADTAQDALDGTMTAPTANGNWWAQPGKGGIRMQRHRGRRIDYIDATRDDLRTLIALVDRQLEGIDET